MDKNKIKGFVDKVYGDMAGAMTVAMAYVGTKTGLFRAMAGKGPLRAADVVAASGLQPRYVEEWLTGMAAAGYLDYDPAQQTFHLPDEHAFLLASEGTDHFMGGLFYFAPTLFAAAPKVADAFRTGGGVRFADFGPDCAGALDVMNGGQYEHRLCGYWLAKLPRVIERLQSGGRVLDFGCGLGRVAITIARTFPSCEVVAVDIDAASIERAKAAAGNEGLNGRIRFLATTAGELDQSLPFDLIIACDCIHDLSSPQQTLSALRELLKPDGTLFIVEPKAADRLEDNFNPVGTMYYGFSLFHCLTQSLAQGGPGLGTCMGPARLRQLLHEAGFRRFEQLDIKSQSHAFYAAGP
ncbi:MAG TPA: class I SAM-dependent methyltransferase [Xanthobacteraceae bacterium]|nr:class I SAM-dependent methyltransferase [Xanthobacteraceae bacterium]